MGMDAPIKKLPKSVQSIICATNQINSYVKAVEELVHNSLDADATSIAIRINIADGFIQVVDNGCGISQQDFKLIGQKFTTSKLTGISTLKSAPNKYGFRGQSLANLIQISESLKVISRFHKCETTWIKAFESGRAKIPGQWNPRPSQGTTIEIKGYLHNLTIQRKTINSVNELQNIKIYLEHISIIHSNISLSLRDDSKYEILYQIHKNRDVYQTLSTLYNIEMADIQELQVEKNQYKLKAFVGKHDAEYDKHFIFLNGKFIHESSSMHKKVNDNFKKNKDNKKKLKKNFYNDEEMLLFANNIPYYFIFITCPYMDYELNKTVLEFRNWEQINTLLEKFIKFYSGDIQVKQVKNTIMANSKKRDSESTRNRIEATIKRILGNHCKEPEISQMQNGVKGKLAKRKHKIKDAKSKLSKVVATTKIDEMDRSSKKTLRKNHKTDSNNYNLRSELRLTPAEYNVNDKNDSASIPFEGNSLEVGKVKKKSILTPIAINKAQKKIGQNQKPCKKKICLNNLFATATESEKQMLNLLLVQTSKEITSKKKHYKGPEKIINESTQYASHGFLTHDRNITVRTNIDEVVIREYVPLPSRRNLEDGINKKNNKQFKSTYDLLQTVITSQQSCNNVLREWITPSNGHEEVIKHYRKSIPLVREIQLSPNHGQPCKAIHAPLQIDSLCLNYEPSFKQKTQILRDAQHREFKSFIENSFAPQLAITDDSSPSFNATTFLSHNYEYIDKEIFTNCDDPCDVVTKHRNFITTQSRENFVDNLHKGKVFRKRGKNIRYSKAIQSNHIKRNFNMSVKHFENNVTHDSQYSIEFTESNDYHSTKRHTSRFATFDITNKMTPSMSFIFNDNNLSENVLPVESCNSLVESENHLYGEIHYEPIHHNSTFTIHNFENNETYSNNVSCNSSFSAKTPNTGCPDKQSNDHYEFVSKKQEDHGERKITNPLDVCEAILQDHELTICKASDFDTSFEWRHDSYSVIDGPLNTIHPTKSHENEVISHHFSITNSNEQTKQKPLPISKGHNENITNVNTQNKESTTVNDAQSFCNNTGAFHIENRLFFVPKGMSPIFKDCNKKPAPDPDFDNNYYDDKIYNDFVHKVQNDVGIFQPRLEVDVTSKDSKVNVKLKKTNASLKFDGMSIRNSNVLGQVDGKFIAATMKGKCNTSEDTDEFLVLFDQHAVHERIRLENNLADYLAGNVWKSVTIEEITLKITRDDILYLHNYREKFTKFGLDWRIPSSNEITITAIPEGILGKNPRPVEKILKAVKNLIKEEINNIQMQKGCVSLYPTSIMDLVFSEACRYAIKFGDLLTNNQCMKLLEQLADCTTPFQCAHGRPAIAVIMNIKVNNADYKINFDKLLELKLKM